MKTTHSKPIYTNEEPPTCCRIVRTALPPALSFMPKPPPRGSHPLRYCEIPHCDGCSGCIFIPPFPHQFDDDLETFYHYSAFEMHALILNRLSGCTIGQHPSQLERTPHSDTNISALFNQTNTAFRECYDSELVTYSGPRPTHNSHSTWSRSPTHSSNTIFPVTPQLQELLDIPVRYSTLNITTHKRETSTLSHTDTNSITQRHKRFCSAGLLTNEDLTQHLHHHSDSHATPSSSLHPIADWTLESITPVHHLHFSSNPPQPPTTIYALNPLPTIIPPQPAPSHPLPTHSFPPASKATITPTQTEQQS